jgi:DNA-binding transcriptional ArsR family regulator
MAKTQKSAAERKQPSTDVRLAKAMSHPLRFRILEALNAEAASPSDLARQFSEPLGNVSYHFKVLQECEAIELVGTKPVRGALEHIYRATARPFLDDEHWSRLPISVRRQLFDAILQGLWDHVVEAAESGGLDDAQTHISWTTLRLDGQGRDEIAELLITTIDRALEINAGAAGRLVGNEGEGHDTELSMLHFDRPSANQRAD